MNLLNWIRRGFRKKRSRPLGYIPLEEGHDLLNYLKYMPTKIIEYWGTRLDRDEFKLLLYAYALINNPSSNLDQISRSQLYNCRWIYNSDPDAVIKSLVEKKRLICHVNDCGELIFSIGTDDKSNSIP